MFGPLGFVPGITPAQVEASSRRGGWGAAGVPTVEHYTKTGAWISMGTPKAVMLEQLRWFAKEVMPKFSR